MSPIKSCRSPLDRNDPSSFSTPNTPIPRSLTKSTPRALTVKPPPFRSRAKNQTEDDISVQPLSQPDDQIVDTSDDPFLIPPPEPREASQCPQSYLEMLPPEILEGIIGHVVGHLGSTTSDPSGSLHTVRNWNAIMRHPRRKKVADLALVSCTWRRLIQERVYRHIKIQGTKANLDECREWFQQNHHLQGYVRHFEVLVPIWEMKPGRIQDGLNVEPRGDRNEHTFLRAFQGLAINTQFGEDIQQSTSAFQLASKNATMEEIFYCAQTLFEGLCALTIEGGHCKHPPQVRYFRQAANISHYYPIQMNPRYGVLPREENFQSKILSLSMPGFRSPPNTSLSPLFPSFFSVSSPPVPRHQLPILPTTKTLILKGAWNMIRCHDDFKVLTAALPALREFHCTYHKPKTMAYATIDEALQNAFPPTITHLNLCLEGLYTKNLSSIKKWRKLYPNRHICRSLGAAAPQLESLTYTGRVCGCLFSTAISAAEATRQSCVRLKSIDIVVNNVCRDFSSNNDGTGIHNWPFIQAFEKLVIQAVRSLQTYTGVKTMRIRFIDLDSPAPLLNPMFHLEGDHAWGMYSAEILSNLVDVRPNVHFGKEQAGHYTTWHDLQPGAQSDISRQCHLHSGKHRCVSMEYYQMISHAGSHI